MANGRLREGLGRAVWGAHANPRAMRRQRQQALPHPESTPACPWDGGMGAWADMPLASGRGTGSQ